LPAKAGIHDFLCCNEGKSWMPAYAGKTWARRRWVVPSGHWYYTR